MTSDHILAASAFVERQFPDCEAALLAGSFVRGDATPTSDLDLVILNPSLPAAYRESFVEGGWMLEAFVHNCESVRQYFATDCQRGRPSLPRMVAEGVVLKNSPLLAGLKAEAQVLLERGPAPWDSATIDSHRYFVTDALLDFIGANSRQEEVFIAGRLAELLHEIILRTNGCWTGNSKWIWKAMQAFDTALAAEFFVAFDSFYRTGDKQLVVALADATLQPHGGRLFGGYAAGKVVK